VGGNALDVHLKGVVPGRDFPLQRVYDLRNAEAGDTCPRCGAALEIKSGLEIGHVFKLGTKYSKSMGANYLDEKGKEVLFIMGCYGIGINRIVAAAVEAGHDDNGIIWPLSLAPYHVEVIPLQVQNAAVIEQSLALEKSLTAAGLDVLVDDRDQRPGFKFKDADLIGIPLRVVVGERGLKDGTVEMKWRAQGEPKLIPAASATQLILAEIDEVRVVLDANSDFFRAGNLEIISKGQVAMTLPGVPEPEGFRHAILNACNAWVPNRKRGPFVAASAKAAANC